MSQREIIAVLIKSKGNWLTTKQITERIGRELQSSQFTKIKGMKNIEFREEMLAYPKSQKRTTQYRWLI